MNYDAIGITTHDLQMGISFLKQLETEAAFPFLSGTIINTATKKTVFTPHTTISRKNLIIGIIGITAPSQIIKNKKYTITDWHQPLNQSLHQLKSADLIILLSNLTHDTNMHIAKSYPDINIILEAGQGFTNKQVLLKDNTLITHTPKDGKYIGELQIDWQKSKQWKTSDHPIIQLKNKIDRLKWLEHRIEKRGGPAKTYKNNPKARQQYNEKMQTLQELQNQLAASHEEPDVHEKTSTYQFFSHPLKPSIPDEQQTTRILKSTRKRVNKLRKKTNVLKRFNAYTGSKSCKKCHATIYASYQTTNHNKAYSTLVHKSANNNPNCIFCHVTGLPERLAYIQAKIPGRLRGVGCEACHGPGQQHRKNPKTYKLTGNVPETTCLTCHTTEHSSDFNYNRDIEFVH